MITKYEWDVWKSSLFTYVVKRAVYVFGDRSKELVSWRLNFKVTRRDFHSLFVFFSFVSISFVGLVYDPFDAMVVFIYTECTMNNALTIFT